jgi:peptidoglycan/LPS O-acetylase OafA/YrhL
VFTFFIISGFLLTRVLANASGMIEFSLNRFLRIVPGFLFCTLATSLVMGAFVTPLDLRAYYSQPETAAYVVNSFKCLCDSWENPFVFAADPELVGVKNGSLWTLSYEVLSYLFLLWLWALLRRPIFVAGAAAAAALATIVSPLANRWMPGIAFTLPYFAAGVVMYVVHDNFGTRSTVAALSFGLLCASALIGLQHYGFALFGAYVVVFLAERPNVGSHFAHRWGDLSYGLYLFGWPVEQFTQQVTAIRSGWQLFIVSLPFVFACAAVSWWAVERPCLSLKKLTRRYSESSAAWTREQMQKGADMVGAKTAYEAQ